MNAQLTHTTAHSVGGSVETALEHKASSQRGTMRYTQLAVAFVTQFPIGTEVTTAAFDEWLAAHGELTVPPEGTPKNSDAWLGHLQRRHICLNRINKSSTHPRITEYGDAMPFVLVHQRGLYLVRAPHDQIVKGEIPLKLVSILDTKRKQLRYLMESADWSLLPAHERFLAEALEDDISLFEQNIRNTADNLGMKFGKLRVKIQNAITSGVIQPRNGGVKRFLESPKEGAAEDLIEEEGATSTPSP
jgi:hypothetical protein